MKKLALLSLAVSQGKVMHNSQSKKNWSKKKSQYFKEMNRLSKKNTYKSALKVLKKYRTRSK